MECGTNLHIICIMHSSVYGSEVGKGGGALQNITVVKVLPLNTSIKLEMEH